MYGRKRVRATVSAYIKNKGSTPRRRYTRRAPALVDDVIPVGRIAYAPSVSTTFATRGWTRSSGELQYNDLAAASYACDTTGSVTALNLIAQGDDVNARKGRQINNVSVRVHGMVAPTGPSATPCYARVMLVWDSQPNSSTIATIANILTASTSVSNTNLDNRARFTILRDWKQAMGAFSTTATQAYAQCPTVSEIDWFVPLKGAVTTYSGTTGTIGVVATGALLLVTIGSAGSNAIAFNATSRLRFKDD